MKRGQLSLKGIAIERLTELGCEHLPLSVIEMVVTRYAKRAQTRLRGLAKRDITIPKIAAVLKEALTHEKGPKGKTGGLSFGEMSPENEVSQGS